MSDQQANVPLWTHWARFTAFMTERFLGGPQILKLAWVINFQKTGTFFYILLLMNYYQNFSLAAYVYLALHGMYGFCWMLKHFSFPEKCLWCKTCCLLTRCVQKLVESRILPDLVAPRRHGRLLPHGRSNDKVTRGPISPRCRRLER